MGVTIPLKEKKVADLQAVLQRKPLDRPVANALLRQLFSGIVVDYTGDVKTLRLHWRQGGETAVVYGMERERGDKRGNLKAKKRRAAK